MNLWGSYESRRRGIGAKGEGDYVGSQLFEAWTHILKQYFSLVCQLVKVLVGLVRMSVWRGDRKKMGDDQPKKRKKEESIDRNK